MLKTFICISFLLVNSVVAQSLQERLALALDPLQRDGGTVLGARLMLLHSKTVELSGTVIGGYVNERSGLPVLGSYEDIADDKDLNFNIKLDEKSKRFLKELLKIDDTVLKKIDSEGLECEMVAYARSFNIRGKPEIPVFPGWRDEKWSTKFNGESFYFDLNGKENYEKAQRLWNSLKEGPKVKVRGVLVIDCGVDCGQNKGVTKNCGLFENEPKIELHPVYEIWKID